MTTMPIVLSLLRGRRRGDDQAASLDAFYGPQAAGYDRFRERLLHGRQSLLQDLDLRPGERAVELGGGTARNLEFIADRLPDLAEVAVVDLCTPLLEVARQRIDARGWTNVSLHQADACTWQPAQAVDVVWCSYSLSMIPDWRLALDNAISWLRPGGRLGVVDFHISSRHPWTSRVFWPRWFGHDGVHLRYELRPTLEQLLEPVQVIEGRGPVPFMPGLRAPHLRFIGRRRADHGT